jgi:hypothetical protein
MKRLDLKSIGSKISNNYNSSNEDDEYEAKVLDEITDDNIIVSATPLSMNNISDNSAGLFFIIETKSGKTNILYTTYLLEEFESEILADIVPYHVLNNFPSFRICADIIINSFTAYITNFSFSYDSNEEKYSYSIPAIEVNKDSIVDKQVKFYMSSDVFCSLKYIDNYMYECDVNNYELSMASISARENDEISETIIVDKVDRIVAMAKIKDSTTYAIEFAVISGENKYIILSTFNLGKKFSRKKFKGMTIDKINDTFLQDSDQYLQIFSEFCRFDNMDKDYLIIKGKNKNGTNKIFMLDGTVRTEFETMIFEY